MLLELAISFITAPLNTNADGIIQPMQDSSSTGYKYATVCTVRVNIIFRLYNIEQTLIPSSDNFFMLRTQTLSGASLG
jgi:hypothetical protein